MEIFGVTSGNMVISRMSLLLVYVQILQVQAINETIDVFPKWFLDDVANTGYMKHNIDMLHEYLLLLF